MPRPRAAAIAGARAVDMNSGRKARRINGCSAGCPNEINARRRQHLCIAVERARIGVEVFVRAELRRVDKDRHDNRIRRFESRCDQCHMTGVQRAHGWHQRNFALSRAQRCYTVPQRAKLIDDLHAPTALVIGFT